MSHLKFDTRDWKFILDDCLNWESLLSLPPYRDFDTAMFEQVIEEGAKFATERLATAYEAGDREGCVAKDGRVTVPEAYEQLYKEYGEGGWIAAPMKPDYGGMGLPNAIVTAVHEAFTGANQALHMYAGLTAGAAHLIENFASKELKDVYVEKMYGGEWGGTMCLTEPHAGSAVGGLRTTATPIDGRDNAYLIEGNKIYISGGDAQFYGNVAHLVLARVKGDPEGIKGVSLFVVPRHLVNEDGSVGEYNNVYVTRIEEKMGIHGSATCALEFGGNGPTEGYLVGEPCQGIRYMFQMMNEARIACGLQGVALANASYQQALAYAKDRKQGPDLEDPSGEWTEIINHPDVRRMLLTMKAYGEGTRALAAQAAFWADFSLHSDDAAEKEKATLLLELATPIVKAYSTDKGFKVTELGVQVFGGFGYTKDYPVEQYLRDCKIASIYEGTNGIQALDLLGRKMRMKGGAAFMTYVQELAGFIETNKEAEGLEDVMKTLQKAQGTLGEVAFWISNNAKKQLKLAMMQATPFLELFGDIMVGHQLANQAVVASAKLQERVGTLTPTAEQLEADPELRYLTGKLHTASFFASEVLSQAPAKSRSMMSGNSAALEIAF